MLQAYDYEENRKIDFEDVSEICTKLDAKRKAVLAAISRKTRLKRRYLISYGELSDKQIAESMPAVYTLEDLQTGEIRTSKIFKELVAYANNLIGANYPAYHYHKNILRGYTVCKRFKIRSSKID